MFRLLILLLLPMLLVHADNQELREETFANLDAWESLTFSRVTRHTRYSIEVRDDGHTVLLAESDNAASGLLWKEHFNPYDLPRLTWRWQIDGVLRKGDARYKAGDDYAVRIAVIFDYDPDDAGLGLAMKYRAYKLVNGVYPPHSSLHYIWANRPQASNTLPNPTTPRTWLLIRQTGNDKAGQWVEESIDILADYRRVFGAEPPQRATLAIMSDTDNTGERATARVDFIRLQPPLQKDQAAAR